MSGPTYKDYFSDAAQGYARYRPGYPPELFSFLASLAPARDLAWDCATGNGQAARGLAEHFGEVVATDASADQLGHATAHPRIAYRRATAEASGLPDACVDLVSVAQAVHWFDLEAFYREVRRVVVADGVIAVWCYELLSASPAVDAVLDRFYREVVGPWWPPERRHIQEQYRNLPFPFAELTAPTFVMEAEWNLEHLLGYLGTWSAARRFQEATGEAPLDPIRDDLTTAWGDPTSPRRLTWPLSLRVGRV